MSLFAIEHHIEEQAGQYNLARCLKRKDYAALIETAQLAQADIDRIKSRWRVLESRAMREYFHKGAEVAKADAVAEFSRPDLISFSKSKSYEHLKHFLSARTGGHNEIFKELDSRTPDVRSAFYAGFTEGCRLILRQIAAHEISLGEAGAVKATAKDVTPEIL